MGIICLQTELRLATLSRKTILRLVKIKTGPSEGDLNGY